MSKFRIALVNHADPKNPDHWAQDVPNRQARAIKRARSLRETNPNVLLFRCDAEGGEWQPVSLRVRTAVTSHKHFGHSSQVMVGEPLARRED